MHSVPSSIHRPVASTVSTVYDTLPDVVDPKASSGSMTGPIAPVNTFLMFSGFPQVRLYSCVQLPIWKGMPVVSHQPFRRQPSKVSFPRDAKYRWTAGHCHMYRE